MFDRAGTPPTITSIIPFNTINLPAVPGHPKGSQIPRRSPFINSVKKASH